MSTSNKDYDDDDDDDETAHADAVAGLPVPLLGLHRTAEPVWSTRLRTLLTMLIAQLPPVVAV